jgi:ATP-dependent helicase/nuclease subunit A
VNRRIVAPAALRSFLAAGPENLDVAEACRRAVAALGDVLESMPGGKTEFLDSGPLFDPAFTLLARDVSRLFDGRAMDPAAVQAALSRVRDHFLTQDGAPRKRLDYKKSDFTSEADWNQHRTVVVANADAIDRVLKSYRRDLNVIVSRGIWRMFQVALSEYRRTLEAHAVLDFSDVLLRALDLLRQMDEFAQSRYRLESRYHHILVDEFQDTSRAQWELVSLLVQSWGEGAGLAHTGPLAPSIFIVGDRKQSIYGFRDADVSVLEEASRYLGRLRPEGDVRRSISRSFRAVPALLSFVNDLCAEIEKVPGRSDAFRYDESDRFPLDETETALRPDALGLVVGDSPRACAEVTAAEVARLLSETDVRDRETGIARRARPGDIAVLFRTRESHREFEEALEARGVPAYVYKGLGFFDADEIKDALALLWYLADPVSDLRAAAFLRSRFIRLSDEGLRLLAPGLADALISPEAPAAAVRLDAHDSGALARARESAAHWRQLVDRLPPAELFDLVLNESAYGVELRGPRLVQARENLKKMRALIRRIQNRGYATIGRLAAHVDRLSAGEESNAVIEALDAVNLMTVHAAKGLEFPIVFVVNLARGTGSTRDAVRVMSGAGEERPASVAVGDFQSDADGDALAREREETKRLLYVALTRARDRLYLGSVLKDGALQPAQGSLADVLPATMRDVFAAAHAGESSVTWRTVHRFRVCAGGEEALAPAAPLSPVRSDDLDPLHDTSQAGKTILEAVRTDEVLAPAGAAHRLIGTLVHRLLQRHGVAAIEGDALDASVRVLLRADEKVDIVDLEAIVTRAASAYRALCARDDVRAVCGAAKRFHEMPFTMRDETGAVLRGTIDCLVHQGEGRLTVLEFKTGRPRGEHRRQIELYKRAAERMFPGACVDALLVYGEQRIGD